MKYSSLIMDIAIVDFLMEALLILINLLSQRRHFPKEVAQFYDKQTYFKALHYNWNSGLVSLSGAMVDLAFMLLVLAFDGLGWLDTQLRVVTAAPIPLGLLYTCLVFLVYDLFTLPVQWIQKFVVDKKYGLNPIKKARYVEEKLQMYLLVVVVGGLFYCLFYYLVLVLGPDFWIWVSLILSLVVLYWDVLYMRIVLPLFNKLRPIPYGELKLAIMAYVKEVEFPVGAVLSMEGATDSTHRTIYFSGVGSNRKAIISHTLIQQHSTEELVAILAREVGHYKKRHGIWMSIATISLTWIVLFLISRMAFSEALSVALGAKELAIHLNLMAAAIIITPIHFMVQLGMKSLRRRNEYQADAYAQATLHGAALANVLTKVAAENLDALFPHPLYVFLKYPYPPVLGRLKALKTASEKGSASKASLDSPEGMHLRQL